jgi:DNA invertase Pin-like site-specific DNA recombinase
LARLTCGEWPDRTALGGGGDGISGSKGREKRPAFDRLHKDAARNRFDIVMAWSVDRISRTVKDLVTFLQELQAANVDLYLYQQAVDTTTPMGRAMFQIARRVRRAGAGDDRRARAFGARRRRRVRRAAGR